MELMSMKFNKIRIVLVSKEFCDYLLLNKEPTQGVQDLSGFRFPSFLFCLKIYCLNNGSSTNFYS